MSNAQKPLPVGIARLAHGQRLHHSRILLTFVVASSTARGHIRCLPGSGHLGPRLHVHTPFTTPVIGKIGRPSAACWSAASSRSNVSTESMLWITSGAAARRKGEPVIFPFLDVAARAHEARALQTT